jgi:ElaB/YqjD/DUF883 family membrane-anchored ribosome-binding protein
MADPQNGWPLPSLTMKQEPPIDETLHQVTEAVRDGTQQAADAVSEVCQSLSAKAEETLLCTKDYVRKNPMPVLLGSLVFGVAIGCLVALARKPAPTLRERFMDDPVHTARDILQATFQPVGRRIHEGYDSARDGAGRAFESFQEHFPTHRSESLGRQFLRNLKFW